MYTSGEPSVSVKGVCVFCVWSYKHVKNRNCSRLEVMDLACIILSFRLAWVFFTHSKGCLAGKFPQPQGANGPVSRTVGGRSGALI